MIGLKRLERVKERKKNLELLRAETEIEERFFDGIKKNSIFDINFICMEAKEKYEIDLFSISQTESGRRGRPVDFLLNDPCNNDEERIRLIEGLVEKGLLRKEHFIVNEKNDKEYDLRKFYAYSRLVFLLGTQILDRFTINKECLIRDFCYSNTKKSSLCRKILEEFLLKDTFNRRDFEFLEDHTLFEMDRLSYDAYLPNLLYLESRKLIRSAENIKIREPFRSMLESSFVAEPREYSPFVRFSSDESKGKVADSDEIEFLRKKVGELEEEVKYLKEKLKGVSLDDSQQSLGLKRRNIM